MYYSVLNNRNSQVAYTEIQFGHNHDYFMQFMIFTKVAEGIQRLINCRGLDRAVFIPVSIFNAVNYHRLF